MSDHERLHRVTPRASHTIHPLVDASCDVVDRTVASAPCVAGPPPGVPHCWRPESVLLLNDDATPSPQAVERLVAAADDAPEVDLFCPKVLMRDGARPVRRR